MARTVSELNARGCMHCGKKAHSRGMCHYHYMRAWRYGDALVERRRYGTGDDITYSQAHKRIKAARGDAKDNSCVECGGQAMDWALIHGTPDTKIGDKGSYVGIEYSTDIWRYQAMCRKHHRAYDRGYVAA